MINFNYKIGFFFKLFSELGKYLISGQIKLQVNQIIQRKRREKTEKNSQMIAL